MNDSLLCVKCQGKGLCGKPCFIYSKFNFAGKIKNHFSGSSPPEIFVGRNGYPQVNTGILSPQEYGETEILSSPEKWHENNFSIANILRARSKLIYARFKSDIHLKQNKFLDLMQLIALASKPVSTEVFLKKAPSKNLGIDSHLPLIGNPAPIENARLEENPKVHQKVDYLTADTDVKSATALNELYKSNIPVTQIMKVLSAGLLGIKKNRKLVPTRWSITATDDTLSKTLLEKIKYYPEISEILLFNSDYLGNHYEFLLLPDNFSFEVIEAKMTGSIWNPNSPLYLAIDYESYHGRKEYAYNVTGAYYVNRLALGEYLEKIKRQASCLVMREARPEYYAPCGVGILREASRNAFSKPPEKFNSITEALDTCQKRLRLPVSTFKTNSWLLKNFGKQKKLSNFIKH